MNQTKANRAVAIFIGIGIVMLIVQVLLGGITRLTGSGLSITEWNILTRSMLPISEARWVEEFEKYKTTPQYNLLNVHFTLSDFKFIYFWEWLHRNWAKLIGIVFLTGFVYLLRKKYIHKNLIKPLLILFLLGALQGVVGWIMVLSGLEGDAVYVKPTRLALHFIFAIALIAYTYWLFLQHAITPANRQNNSPMIRFTWILLSLLAVQLIFGALMAGHKAATAAPTWPDINGEWVPASIGESGGLKNLIADKISVHFVHRTTGYILLFGLILYAGILRRYSNGHTMLSRFYLIPELLGGFQVLLGVLTLVTSRQIEPNSWGLFETVALLHQLTALLLVLSLITILYLVSVKSFPPQS